MIELGSKLAFSQGMNQRQIVKFVVRVLDNNGTKMWQSGSSQSFFRAKLALKKHTPNFSIFTLVMADDTVAKTVEDLIKISNAINPRYCLYQRYSEWKEKVESGGIREIITKEPCFYDENRKIYRSGKYALAPCKLINENLSELVEVTLKTYTPKNSVGILKTVKNVEFSEHLEILRNSAIIGEEQMEQDALDFVFKMVDNNELHALQIVEPCKIQGGFAIYKSSAFYEF